MDTEPLSFFVKTEKNVPNNNFTYFNGLYDSFNNRNLENIDRIFINNIDDLNKNYTFNFNKYIWYNTFSIIFMKENLRNKSSILKQKKDIELKTISLLFEKFNGNLSKIIDIALINVQFYKDLEREWILYIFGNKVLKPEGILKNKKIYISYINELMDRYKIKEDIQIKIKLLLSQQSLSNISEQVIFFINQSYYHQVWENFILSSVFKESEKKVYIEKNESDELTLNFKTFCLINLNFDENLIYNLARINIEFSINFDKNICNVNISTDFVNNYNKLIIELLSNKIIVLLKGDEKGDKNKLYIIEYILYIIYNNNDDNLKYYIIKTILEIIKEFNPSLVDKFINKIKFLYETNILNKIYELKLSYSHHQLENKLNEKNIDIDSLYLTHYIIFNKIDFNKIFELLDIINEPVEKDFLLYLYDKNYLIILIKTEDICIKIFKILKSLKNVHREMYIINIIKSLLGEINILNNFIKKFTIFFPEDILVILDKIYTTNERNILGNIINIIIKKLKIFQSKNIIYALTIVSKFRSSLLIILDSLNDKNIVPITKNIKDKTKSDFLIISYNEESNEFTFNDCLSVILRISLEKPAFVVICTQESILSGEFNYQHVIGDFLNELNFGRLLKVDAFDRIVQKKINNQNIRTRIYYNKSYVTLPNMREFINKNLIENKTFEKNNNIITNEYIIETYGHKKEENATFIRLKFKKNGIYYKFIIVNTQLLEQNLDSRFNKFKELIDKFRLIDFWKKEYNIFFCGDLNFKLNYNNIKININELIKLNVISYLDDNSLYKNESTKNLFSRNELYKSISENKEIKSNTNTLNFYSNIINNLIHIGIHLTAKYNTNHGYLENLKVYKKEGRNIQENIKKIFNKSITPSATDKILYVLSQKNSNINLNRCNFNIHLHPDKSSHKMISLSLELVNIVNWKTFENNESLNENMEEKKNNKINNFNL